MCKKKLLRMLSNTLVGVLTSATATLASADILVMGGNPAGSLFYTQAQGLATIINRNTDDRVDILPQPGTVFFPMFMTKEVDFGIASPIEAKLAYDAEDVFNGANGGKGYEMRTLMLGAVNRLSLVTRESENIRSLKDLKGRRVVANYGAFAAGTKTALAALANAGLTAEDISIVPVSSYPEGVRAVMEGRADAAVGSVGSGILQELDAQSGARLLPIDPSAEAMARSKNIGPAFVPFYSNAGPVGIKEDSHVLSYQTTLFARPDMDSDAIKRVMNALWNHADELPSITRTLSTWLPERYANTDAVIPFHPTAIEFYREKGVWTDEMESHQKKLLSNQKVN